MNPVHIISLLGIGLFSAASQPLEVIKIRMQLKNIGSREKACRRSIDLFRKIISTEGFLGLYKGGSALILKTFFSSTSYHISSCYIFKDVDTESRHMYWKLYAPGYCIAFCVTPAEVAHVRMSSDGRLPIQQRRNYRNVFHAISRIYVEEGILALWRGATPSMSITGLNMAVYTMNTTYNTSEVDTYITKILTENATTREIVKIGVTGFFTAIISMPMDLAKTRLQEMRVVNGSPYYSGVQLIYHVITREGIKTLWRGFLLYYIRIFPYSLCTLDILNKMCVEM